MNRSNGRHDCAPLERSVASGNRERADDVLPHHLFGKMLLVPDVAGNALCVLCLDRREPPKSGRPPHAISLVRPNGWTWLRRSCRRRRAWAGHRGGCARLNALRPLAPAVRREALPNALACVLSTPFHPSLFLVRRILHSCLSGKPRSLPEAVAAGWCRLRIVTRSRRTRRLFAGTESRRHIGRLERSLPFVRQSRSVMA